MTFSLKDEAEEYCKEHPWICRWDHFKFHFTEFLARWFNIHLNW